MSPYPDDDVLSPIDRLPRTISGGLALPPRQLPPPAPRTVALEVTPDAVTRIVTRVADAFDALRRAAADRGLS